MTDGVWRGGSTPAPLGRRRAAFDGRLVDRIVTQLRLADGASAPATRRPRRRRRYGGAVANLLESARRETDMDVALLGEIRQGHEVVAALAGRGSSFGLRVGASLPIEATYCHLVLQGRLPNLVADAQNEPQVNDLALTRIATIGAYIGVPLTALDARLYMLCCLAHEQRPALSERHVLRLRELAQGIAVELRA